jgi:hypothetical protein
MQTMASRHQHQRHRLSDDVARADHDDVLASIGAFACSGRRTTR